MKTMFLVLAVFMMMLTVGVTAHAQTQPVEGAQIGPFAAGLDNALLFEKGESGGFLAIGAGIDIASYVKTLGGASNLSLTLHGSVLERVTNTAGAPSAAIFAAAAYVDIIKLIGGKVTILIPNLSLAIGPCAAFDTASGKLAYGGMGLVKWTF